MIRQRILCRTVWSLGYGVAEFQKEVNAHLLEGWFCRDLSVIPGWLLTTCVVLLEMPPDEDD